MQVVPIGRKGGEHISAEEVALWAETINREVTTSLMPRVARIYVRGRRAAAQA
ncbi:MAG: alanine racemase C-terminal domain-containing protein [Anaerolineae bacterium]